MKETHQLLLQPGLVVNQEIFDYKLMQESAKNWLFSLKYRLGKGVFYGCHNGIQLYDLQFGHADRHEGLMYEGYSPKECLTIALIQKSPGTLCINNLKLQEGDICVIDDQKPYYSISSQGTKIAIISIRKSLIRLELPCLLSSTDKKFRDKKQILSETIEREWMDFSNIKNLAEKPKELEGIQKRIVTAIKRTMIDQEGEYSHLTQGEQTALEVKSFLLTSLTESASIQSITQQFNISDKTLETSFKSLFGITPKCLINIINLNRAHEDLLSTDGQNTNVSDIATKWGFSHFGRFSKNYKELFGVSPSETLKLL